MRQRSMVILTAVLTTGALTLTACGSRDDDGGEGERSRRQSGGDGDERTLTHDQSFPWHGRFPVEAVESSAGPK